MSGGERWLFVLLSAPLTRVLNDRGDEMARSPRGGHAVPALIAALLFSLVLLPAGAKDPGAGKTAVLL